MQWLFLERIRHRSPFTYVLLVFSYVTASKISFIYVQGCEKRNPSYTCQHGPKIRFEILNSRNLDRSYLSSLIKPRQIAICREAVELFVRGCRAICPALMNSFLHLFFGSIFMALILDLNNMFFEILNTSQIYPNTSKLRFVKELANYIKW